MKKPVFELSYFLHKDETYHIARVNITSAHDLSVHAHDYAELLWIEKGHGVHHVNGEKLRVGRGDMFMMRPDDTHTFSSSGKGLTLINIAFSRDTLDYLKTRYFPTSEIYFWSGSRMPYSLHLSDTIIKRISARAEESFKQQRTNLQLDSLLLFILRQITANEKFSAPDDVPEWLFNAVQIFSSTAHFSEGIQGFIRLCDRNPDHINRSVKMYFGMTLSALVNRFRMNYAATQLTMTSMPIKEICRGCGFENMGHFYRVFRSVYDQTPKEYRKINQTIV